MCTMTHESIKRPDGRQGTYVRSFDETTRIHERLAENGIRFSIALHQMHDDILELANGLDKGRKYWKQYASGVEKKSHEVEMLVERVTRQSGLAFLAALC